MKKLLKIITMLVLLVSVLAYVGYVMLFMPKEREDDVCNGILLQIEENPRADFINGKNIKGILKTEKLNPVGQKMKDVNLTKIEELIRTSQYVDSVECYKTVDGKVAIKIRQRTPVMFVLSDSLKGYYLDKNGNVVPNSNYAFNLPVATGHIGKEYARDKLVDFGKFLFEDAFWNDQIEQINVSNDEHNNPVVELIPRVGNQVIFLGPIDDYRIKLKRLRTFYDKVVPTIGMDKYSRFNLEYPNQVICTKR